MTFIQIKKKLKERNFYYKVKIYINTRFKYFITRERMIFS